jgi:bacterioferritin
VKVVSNVEQAVAALNRALAWELRASLMYAHYAAYVMGRDRLDFEEHFQEEATESMGHARTVRQIIADLGGVAVTVPDATPFPHTQDATAMLEEALRTEARAEAAYREALPLFEHFSAWHHSLRHIMHDEEGAQLEIRRLLKQA